MSPDRVTLSFCFFPIGIENLLLAPYSFSINHIQFLVFLDFTSELLRGLMTAFSPKLHDHVSENI